MNLIDIQGIFASFREGVEACDGEKNFLDYMNKIELTIKKALNEKIAKQQKEMKLLDSLQWKEMKGMKQQISSRNNQQPSKQLSKEPSKQEKLDRGII